MSELRYTAFYENIYKKIGIYNRNTRFINEGYAKLSNNIAFNFDEQKAINEMLLVYREELINQYMINEGISEKIGEYIHDPKKIQNFISNILDKIPTEILNAYQLLSELIEKGIKTVKEFIAKLTELFQKLGNNLKDVLTKFGFFNEDIIKEIPDTNIEIDSNFNIKDEKEQKIFKFLCGSIQLGMSNQTAKEFMLNEGIKYDDKIFNEFNQLNEGKIGDFVKDHKKGIAIASVICPPVGIAALLAGGGYGLYKCLGALGKVMSNVLEPILLSDKSKKFAQDLADNQFFKLAFGLRKTAPKEEDESKLHYAGRVLHTIILNGIVAWCISTASVLITPIVPINPVTISLVVACVLGARNIFKIIINRINNFKKETIDKKGNKHTHYFFDLVTMAGIMASVTVILLKIPGVKELFTNALEKLITSTSDSASASTAWVPPLHEGDKGHFIADYTTKSGDHVMAFRDPKTGYFYKVNNDYSIPDAANFEKNIVNISDMDYETASDLVLDYDFIQEKGIAIRNVSAVATRNIKLITDGKMQMAVCKVQRIAIQMKDGSYSGGLIVKIEGQESFVAWTPKINVGTLTKHTSNSQVLDTLEKEVLELGCNFEHTGKQSREGIIAAFKSINWNVELSDIK